MSRRPPKPAEQAVGSDGPTAGSDAAPVPSSLGAWIFIAVFGVLATAYFAVIPTFPFKEGVARPVLAANATVATVVLRLLGEDAQVVDTRIVSSRFVMNIARGCDGLDALALYVAGMVAFPAPRRKKLVGLAIGVCGIQVLNLVRLVSLYYVGVYWRAAFDTFHVEVWQPVFVVLVLAGWLWWAWWCRHRRGV